MSVNLVDLVTRELSGTLGQKLSAAIGAAPQATATGVGAAVPAVLGGLLSKIGSAGGLAEAVSLLNSGNFESVLGNLGTGLASAEGTKSLVEKGASVLPAIFGARAGAISSYISGAAGTSAASSSALLGIAAPAVLGFITRHLRSAGTLHADGLKSLLAGQRDALKAAPAGLASALGLASLSDLPGSAAAPTPAAPPPAVAAPAATPPPPAPPSDGLIERKLADGTTIRIAPAGVESKLLDFIEDNSKVVDKTTWFSFDRLEFETGSATLKASAGAQLDNIAAIMKAYPQVELKIGGYTDNTGNKAQNLKLSQDRAKAAMDGIVSRGTAAARLASEGYGEEHPVADNATEAGRAQNRRIDVRVTKK